MPSLTDVSNQATNTDGSSDDDQDLLITAVALSATTAALVCCLAVVTVVVIAAILFYRWRRRRWATEHYGLEDPDSIPMDTLGHDLSTSRSPSSSSIIRTPSMHRSQSLKAVYATSTQEREAEREKEKEKEKERDSGDEDSIMVDPLGGVDTIHERQDTFRPAPFRKANTVATFMLNIPGVARERLARASTVPQDLSVDEGERSPLTTPRAKGGRIQDDSDEDI